MPDYVFYSLLLGEGTLMLILIIVFFAFCMCE